MTNRKWHSFRIRGRIISRYFWYVMIVLMAFTRINSVTSLSRLDNLSYFFTRLHSGTSYPGSHFDDIARYNKISVPTMLSGKIILSKLIDIKWRSNSNGSVFLAIRCPEMNMRIDFFIICLINFRAPRNTDAYLFTSRQETAIS